MNFYLPADYRVEVDSVNKDEWPALMLNFDDATIYQSWSYGKARWAEKKLSHLVLRRNGEIVGAAQLVIMKAPLIKAGIAYAPWGPLWKRRGAISSAECFRTLLRALRVEYSVKRGLAVRISPNCTLLDNSQALEILKSEDFDDHREGYRTFILDLTPSLESLRKALHQKWRNQLNRAERNGLTIVEGSSNTLFEEFKAMYREMIQRKNYETSVSIEEFQVVQDDLPDIHKMKIMICKSSGLPVAGLIASAMGDRGIYLFGATSEAGMKSKGSYLLQWEMIKFLKEGGFRYYDLGGIDPINNPGVFHFKAGLAGKDVSHIGQFETCANHTSSQAVRLAEKAKKLHKKWIRP